MLTRCSTKTCMLCMAARLTAGSLVTVPLQRWGRSLQSSRRKSLYLSHRIPLLLSRRNRSSHYGGCYCTKVSNATSLHTSEVGKLVIPRGDPVKDNWSVKMLFDGDCPLCMREVNMLMERNLTYKTIKFVDISAADYSPRENAGIDFATAMGRIHAILPDGTILYDIELARIADAIYSIWAKYRLPITGRPPLVQILEERQRKAKEECEPGNCQID